MLKILKKLSFVIIILAPVFVYAKDYRTIMSGIDVEAMRYSDFEPAYIYLFMVVLVLIFFSGYITSKR